MDHRLDISVDCDLAAIACAQEAIRTFAAAHNLPERVTFGLELAADELLSNVIRHGFSPDQADRRIRCAAEVLDGRAVLIFTDNGAAFDPLTDAPHPDLSSGAVDAPIGGLGVHIVKTLADACRYSRQDGLNRLELGWTL